jgi:hypothetical protein
VNSHSVKGCIVTIAEAMWEVDAFNIPKSFTFNQDGRSAFSMTGV